MFDITLLTTPYLVMRFIFDFICYQVDYTYACDMVPCLPQSHILLCKGFDLGIPFGLLGPKLIARKQQEAHLKTTGSQLAWKSGVMTGDDLIVALVILLPRRYC